MVEHTVINITPLQDIKNFPTKEINDNTDTISVLSYNDLCSICYSKIEKKSKTFSCSHKYHKICINEWFKNNTTCPNCRKDIINEFIKVKKNNKRHRPNIVHPTQPERRVIRQEQSRRCFINIINNKKYNIILFLVYLIIMINNLIAIHISEDYINNNTSSTSKNYINMSFLIIFINIFYFGLSLCYFCNNEKTISLIIALALLYFIIIIIYSSYIRKIVSLYKDIGENINNNLLISLILYMTIIFYKYIHMILLKVCKIN